MNQNSKKLPAIALVLIGLSLTFPVLLISALTLVVDSKLQSKQSPQSGSQGMSQNYARAFHMIIREQGQNVHIWTRNLDKVPDFRQVVETDGKIISQQLYIGAEKTLYSSQQNPGPDSPWSKTGNLEPKAIGISNITTGPAVWALQYGVGDNQVRLQQGTLNITVKSVNQPIDDTVFQTTGTVDLN